LLQILGWLHLISFYRGFQALGQFGVILYRMFFLDVGRFITIYRMLLQFLHLFRFRFLALSFFLSFFLLFISPFTSFNISIFATVIVLLGFSQVFYILFPFDITSRVVGDPTISKKKERKKIE
jgi:hypothetical protein